MAEVQSVKSPCVSVCALDVNDVCVGCYRTGQEITRWSSLDDDGKRAVLRYSAERARDANGGLL